MRLEWPYYRIYRPDLSGSISSLSNTEYLRDARYASDRVDLIRGYHYLEQDLLHAFEFIEPADSNLKCHSHRLYALLLRASTEFETNSKAVLAANGYTNCGNWNITDYHKIDRAMRLSEYSLTLSIWTDGSKTIHPFSEWKNGHSLSWYQDYNSVKHDRSQEFSRATLENVILAIGAVFAVLFAQFVTDVFDKQGRTTTWIQSDGRTFSRNECMFQVTPCNSWKIDEMYDFNWATANRSASPFRQFQF